MCTARPATARALDMAALMSAIDAGRKFRELGAKLLEYGLRASLLSQPLGSSVREPKDGDVGATVIFRESGCWDAGCAEVNLEADDMPQLAMVLYTNSWREL